MPTGQEKEDRMNYTIGGKTKRINSKPKPIVAHLSLQCENRISDKFCGHFYVTTVNVGSIDIRYTCPRCKGFTHFTGHFDGNKVEQSSYTIEEIEKDEDNG